MFRHYIKKSCFGGFRVLTLFSMIWLMSWNAFAQLAFDPTVGAVSADNPFKDVGEAGASIIQSVQTYLSPLIILAALIALFIMKLMNKLDWTWALRVTFVSLCLIFVNEITSWLLSFGG